MKLPDPKLILAALLGACCFACNNSSDSVANPQGPRANPDSERGFDRSALAIKASPSSQEVKIAAIEALAARYGHIVATQTDPDPGSARAAENAEPGALGKAAASRFFTMKSKSFNNNFVLIDEPTVKPNQTYTAWTSREDGSTVDPVIVGAYYTSSLTVGDAHYVKIIGLSDDDGETLDSRIVWKNTTGSDKWLHVIVFPYTPALSGIVTFNANLGGRAGSVTDRTDGIAVYSNNVTTLPVDGCSAPGWDRLTLQVNQPGDFLYGTMMVNARDMTGAMIFTGGLAPTQSITLFTPTPNGYPNFMLVFAMAKELGGGSSGSHLGRQEQRMSCTF